MVLSASHNPMPDNGIKFLARGGHKLDDALEIEIEQHLGQDWQWPDRRRRRPGRRLRRPPSRSTPPTWCAPPSARWPGCGWCSTARHGAASDAGPQALQDAGAFVTAIHAQPDGLNINDGCGSTHLDSLRAAVLKDEADVGFALDGDADRCLAVDHEGNVVDGDQILAILALAMKESGTLVKDTVVATVMSNLGFVQAMRGRRHRRPADQGGRPLRARGDAGRRATPSAASSPAT